MNVISNIVNLKEWAEKYAKEWILTQNTSISSVSPLSCENIDRSVPTRERLCVCECVQTHAQVCYALRSGATAFPLKCSFCFWFYVSFCFSLWFLRLIMHKNLHKSPKQVPQRTYVLVFLPWQVMPRCGYVGYGESIYRKSNVNQINCCCWKTIFIYHIT